MKKYKIISLILAVNMVLQLMPTLSLAQSPKKNFAPIEPACSMSDEEFFGIWSGSDWLIEPKMDYNTNGMEKVGQAAKTNDLELAKEELLTYYQSKNTKPAFNGGSNTAMNYTTLNDTYGFTETYMTSSYVSGNKFRTYDINLGTNAANGSIMLCTIEKMQDVVEIKSRESDAPPQLIFVTSDGVETVTPERDTYIRGGKYADVNYGKDSIMYVKDSYTENADGTYLPYGDLSRITYLYFNPAQFPRTFSSVKLRITAKVAAEEDSEFKNEDIKLAIFQAYNKTWSEYEGDAENKKGNLPMTWNAYKIGHFSWKGLPGGYDWKKPSNTASEWHNYNTRFYDQVSLMRTAENNNYTGTDANGFGYGDDYVYKAMSIVQDFIKDGGAGIPNNRDIESANRCLEFPSLYYRYIHTDYITPELNVAMLKWLWQEVDYLYNGAGVLYQGKTAIPKNASIAHNNRGAWHVYGYLNTSGNFPEFAQTPEWRTIIEDRLVDNINVLLQPDGSYEEPTFSYPISVMNFFIQIGNLYKALNIDPPANYYERLRLFARYLMDCAYPTGKTPWWGDGSGSPKGIVKTLLTYVEDEELSYMVGTGGTYPSQHYSLYPDAKVATDRTSWDSPASVLFMNARNGGSHSHRDALAITWYHKDRELLNDTGVSSYDSKHPHFYWQRNRSISHNTVEIDGVGQEASGDSYIDITTNDGTSVMTAWTDANKSGRHLRNVNYIKPLGIIIVNDRMVPNDDDTHTYTQNWHNPPLPSPEITLETDGELRAQTHYSTGSNIIIAPITKDGITSTLADGYNADGAVSTKFISYEQETAGTATYDTLLYAVDDGTSATVTTEPLEVAAEDSTATASRTTVTANGATYILDYLNTFGSQYNLTTFADTVTDGKQAGIAKDADGNIIYASVTSGSILRNNDVDIFETDAIYSDITLNVEGNTVNVYTSTNIGNKEIAINGLGDNVSKATLNGKSVNFQKKNGKAYINTQFNYISDTAGSFTGAEGQEILWTYYAQEGILHFEGEGNIGDFVGKSLPWATCASDATAVWISPKLTGITSDIINGLSNIKEVYMDESCFDTSWGTTSPKQYNTDGMAILTEGTYSESNLPPDYDANGNHVIGTSKYQYGPDTWAKSIHTIKDEFKFAGNVRYIAASGTDSVGYQPKEIQIDKVPTYYYCQVSNIYSWSVNPVDGTLTIDTPSGHMGGDLVRSGEFYPWFGMKHKITSIYFNDNVSRLSKHHFDGLSGVKSIRFSPKMNQFGAYSFTSCSGLKTITIPGNITSITSKSFRDCSNLKEVIILQGNKEVSISADAFSGSTSLRTLVLPDNVTVIAGAKSGWTSTHKLTKDMEKCTIYAPEGSAGHMYAVAMNCTYIPLNQKSDASGTVADTNITWEYTADTNTIVFDGEGSIPALHDFADSFGQNMWKAYCGVDCTIRLGTAVDVEEKAFRGVTQAKYIYCDLADCNFTYKKNANLDFPESFTLDDGTEICSANGIINTSRFKPGYFDCETTATARPYYGYYYSYNSSTSWEDIKNSLNTQYEGCIYYEYDFDTKTMTITPYHSPSSYGYVHIGNSSILSTNAYPWSLAGINNMAEHLDIRQQENLTVTLIGKAAFTGFAKLKEIILPHGITSIGMRAFKNCTSATKIVIPDTVISSGAYTFGNSPLVSDVTIMFGANVGTNTFASETASEKSFATDTINCYAGSVSSTVNYPKNKTNSDTYKLNILPYVSNNGTLITYALPQADNGKLIIACYDDQGKLAALDMQDISVEANIFADYISPLNLDDYPSSKLMIWKMNNLKPIVAN